MAAGRRVSAAQIKERAPSKNAVRQLQRKVLLLLILVVWVARW